MFWIFLFDGVKFYNVRYVSWLKEGLDTGREVTMFQCVVPNLKKLSCYDHS